MEHQLSSGTSISIKLLYFAKARELAGTNEETVSVSLGTDVNSVIAQALLCHPELTKLGYRSAIAVNQEYVTRDKDGKVVCESGGGIVLQHGDEVAFIPPISGG